MSPEAEEAVKKGAEQYRHQRPSKFDNPRPKIELDDETIKRGRDKLVEGSLPKDDNGQEANESNLEVIKAGEIPRQLSKLLDEIDKITAEENESELRRANIWAEAELLVKDAKAIKEKNQYLHLNINQLEETLEQIRLRAEI